jgi:hypothetical protein
MLRHSLVGLTALLLLAGAALAADKEVKCKLVKADAKNNLLTVINQDGKKLDYDINANTKFIGPKGGISDLGIKDERLVKGVELKLVVAGNNRTVREVHIPTRKIMK